MRSMEQKKQLWEIWNNSLIIFSADKEVYKQIPKKIDRREKNFQPFQKIDL